MCITNVLFIQSQVYRSQPDLVSAAYDATGTTLPADYTYSQYPNPSDTVDYSQIPYSTDNTWTAQEQRKYYTQSTMSTIMLHLMLGFSFEPQPSVFSL